MPPSPRCATARTSPAPSTASTPATACSRRRSPRAADSGSTSSPASRTSPSCPTRPRSGSCRGRIAPAGCSATRTSRTARRCRSTAARCCASRWRGSSRPGYHCYSGLEVEFYITRFVDEGRIALDQTGQPGPAPVVDVIERGYQFLSDHRLDAASPLLETLRDALWDVGLPPRSIEDEWGPGQFEFTFSPLEGLDAADSMILFRSTMKAICARRGLLASFMCWPALPNFFPSGWHLHQSLVDISTGENAFVHPTEVLSPRRDAVRGRPARQRAGDDAVRRPDRERVCALPALLLRPRPDRLGGRQPRRADPHPGRPRRRQHARREPHERAGREPVHVAGGEHRGRARRHRARRHAAAARSSATRTPRTTTCCRSRSARRRTSWTAPSSTAPSSATRSSTTS